MKRCAERCALQLYQTSLRHAIIKKEIPENENLDKIVDIVKNIRLKHQKYKAIKISATTQMFQRLPIALAHVEAGNTSKNLLNEIR